MASSPPFAAHTAYSFGELADKFGVENRPFGANSFETLLRKFENQYGAQARSIAAQMKAAEEVIGSKKYGLQSAMNVRHTPVSSRVKDRGKAVETLKRRQQDRIRLRELKSLVEDCGDVTWERYCRDEGIEEKMDQAKPFESTDEMFDAMHDLAGLRISLYFPDDVGKVQEFLRNQFDLIELPKSKGSNTRSSEKINRLIERQKQRRLRSSNVEARNQGVLGERTDSSPAKLMTETTFPGYRATHMVIRHKKYIDKYAQYERPVNIEVQIGTIVMHAWSDIEHDILYKPAGSLRATPDMVRMLDMINGVVMTGEVALRQLAALTAAQETLKAIDDAEEALNSRYIVKWLDTYCIKSGMKLPENDYHCVRTLFSVLKAARKSTFGTFVQLMDETRREDAAEQKAESLPLRALHYLGRDTFPFRDLTLRPSDFAEAWNARYWTTMVVNTLNLCLYTGSFPWSCWEDGLKVTTDCEKPTMLEILDILHPRRPSHQQDRLELLTTWCRTILGRLQLSNRQNERIDHICAMKLASAGYGISFSREGTYKRSGIMVPHCLWRLTSDSKQLSLMFNKKRLAEDVFNEAGITEKMFYVSESDDRGKSTWRRVTCGESSTQGVNCMWDISFTKFSYDPSLEFKSRIYRTRDYMHYLGFPGSAFPFVSYGTIFQAEESYSGQASYLHHLKETIPTMVSEVTLASDMGLRSVGTWRTSGYNFMSSTNPLQGLPSYSDFTANSRLAPYRHSETHSRRAFYGPTAPDPYSTPAARSEPYRGRYDFSVQYNISGHYSAPPRPEPRASPSDSHRDKRQRTARR